MEEALAEMKELPLEPKIVEVKQQLKPQEIQGVMRASFDKFRAQFTAAANGLQGSGWAVLGYDSLGGRLLTFQLWLALPLLMLIVFAAVWGVSTGDPLGFGAWVSGWSGVDVLAAHPDLKSKVEGMMLSREDALEIVRLRNTAAQASQATAASRDMPVIMARGGSGKCGLSASSSVRGGTSSTALAPKTTRSR